MANEEHLARLREGVEAWNRWRREGPLVSPDLSETNLSNANLSGADLSWANLGGADLSYTNLSNANLSGAHLSGANLREARVSGADLSVAHLEQANLSLAKLDGADLSSAYLSDATFWGADLSGAKMSWANLSQVDFSRANLSRADLTKADLYRARLASAVLSGADLTDAILVQADFYEANLRETKLDRASLGGSSFVQTNIEGASFRGGHIYGVSVWDVKGQPAEQRDLVITPYREPEITTDNLRVAQFIYLLLNNPDIREVIDTITSKVVLILGRFTKERKPVLDALRDELRKRNKLPVLFDFTPCDNRDTVETIRTLAGMAQFIIADITDAKSIIGELKDVVPNFPSVPVQPIIHVGDVEYGMFDHIKRFAWVLEPYQYKDTESLLAALGPSIVEPAENKWRELRALRPPSG